MEILKRVAAAAAAFQGSKHALLFAKNRIILAMWLASSLIAFGSSFEEANELFEKGKFAEARDIYQQFVERGEWSANLFSNLGDTEFRLGEPGRAILFYERALAFNPSHPEAARNIQTVRDRAGSHIAPASLWDTLFPRLTVDVFAITAAIMGWLAILILARIFVRRKAGRPGGLWPGFTFCMAVALYAGAALWHHRRDASLAVIIRSKPVSARLAPADLAGLAEALPSGSQVHVLSERGEWTYCELPGKGLGWIPSTALEKVRIVRS